MTRKSSLINHDKYLEREREGKGIDRFFSLLRGLNRISRSILIIFTEAIIVNSIFKEVFRRITLFIVDRTIYSKEINQKLYAR